MLYLPRVVEEIWLRVAELVTACTSNYFRGIGWSSPTYLAGDDVFVLHFGYQKRYRGKAQPLEQFEIKVLGETIRNPPYRDTIIAYWLAHELEKLMEARGIDWREDYTHA